MNQLRKIPIFLVLFSLYRGHPLEQAFGLTKAIWWSEENQHVDSFRANPQGYLNKVPMFFQDNMTNK